MNLDFTKLKKLGEEKQEEERDAKERFKTPDISPKSSNRYNCIKNDKNAVESKIEANRGIRQLQRKSEQKKEQIERANRVYKTYQENILASNTTQSEILKELKTGENIYSLFLKAVKVISLLTSNTVLYEQAKSDIINIYGIGLNKAGAISIDLEESKAQLAKLEEAITKQQEERTIKNIKRAIKAHREKIEELEKIIERQGVKA